MKNALYNLVSFGMNIRQPHLLQTRRIGDIALDIQQGRWAEQLTHVRGLRFDSDEQRAAKEGLPYVLWPGSFAPKRGNDNLRKHSGLIGIDIDHLSRKEVRAVMHKAMDDDYVAVAYRSTRLNGVWLVFRIPEVDSQAAHKEIFKQVAAHVRTVYGHEPDKRCSDVSRASFVSWDAGIWMNGEAQVFPFKRTACPIARIRFDSVRIQAPVATPRTGKPLSKGQVSSIWHLGSACAPIKAKPDEGTYFTHDRLKKLAWQLAVQHRKGRLGDADVEQVLDEAAGGWFTEAVPP
jgi:VirE-like protein